MALSLLDGLVGRSTPGRRVEVINENFLQLGGVRPGVNTLSFAVDQLRSARVRAVQILPDSGTFALRARRKGDSRLAVTVDSASASPTAAVPVRIAPRQSALDRIAPFPVLVVVAGTALALGGAALVRRRRE